MFVFRKIWRALFPCYLRLEIRLLPYYRRTILIKWMPVTHVNPQEGLATFSESMIWKPVDWLLYQTSRHWFPHSKKWTSKCWKNVQNIQGAVTESRFPSGHWKVFNRCFCGNCSWACSLTKDKHLDVFSKNLTKNSRRAFLSNTFNTYF